MRSDEEVVIMEKVAFGFLSKEFATVFGQMNGGTATAVEISVEEKKKIGKNKS